MANSRKATKGGAKDRPVPAAAPAWRLPEPVPKPAPPGRLWKWLLAAAILIQAAWIIALVLMAIK